MKGSGLFLPEEFIPWASYSHWVRVYLDENYRGDSRRRVFSDAFRISPLIAQAASVLELPTHTIYSSQTQPGDQLVICVAEENGIQC